ncbi:pentapeptide repeat-containing protein [Pseudenhygromyxa sp. WMMC2535]|uniref:pentapeptide repeat-containing protein n=1 Tax=Pseudenhygromyxa sp. WMMC2535 TaxID=2712867 RepID=UPI0031F8B5ED
MQRADAEALLAAFDEHPLSGPWPAPEGECTKDQDEQRAGVIDSALTWRMAANNDVPPNLDDRLRAHAKYLAGLHARSGGPPGQASWVLLEVSGIPMALLQAPKVDQGEALALQLANLAGCDLSGRVLSWVGLVGLYAPGLDCSAAVLYGAALTDAQLEGACFRGADLREADLSRARLVDACFAGADLRDADFERADLSGADFSGADLRGASFLDAIQPPSQPN